MWKLDDDDDDDDDDDVTILLCAQKLTDASLIYRAEPETKTEKKRTKNKEYIALQKEANADIDISMPMILTGGWQSRPQFSVGRPVDGVARPRPSRPKPKTATDHGRPSLCVSVRRCFPTLLYPF